MLFPFVVNAKSFVVPNSRSYAVLDKDLAGQGSQRARGQRVLDETLGLRRARRIHLHAFDAQFQSALDVAEFHDFDACCQRSGAAAELARPSATDPVDEILGDLRHVIVNDMSDVVAMQAARGDIVATNTWRAAS
jgi:hypothetical protein